MDEYKIGSFTFNSEEEYRKAKKEIALIKAMKDKFDLNNPKIVRIILSKYTPETIIGKRFVNNLKTIVEQEDNSNNQLLDAIDSEIKKEVNHSNTVSASAPQTNIYVERPNQNIASKTVLGIDTSESKQKSSTNQVRAVVDTVKAKSNIITSKIQNRLQEEDVQTAKEQMKNQFAAASKNVKQYINRNDFGRNEEHGKENKKPITEGSQYGGKRLKKGYKAAFVLFILFTIGITYFNSNSGGNTVFKTAIITSLQGDPDVWQGGMVTDLNTAQKIVENNFSPDKYVIEPQLDGKTVDYPVYWFLGKNRYDVEKIDINGDEVFAYNVYYEEIQKIRSVPTYCFLVHTARYTETYTVFVAENGRVVKHDLDYPGLYSLVK